MRWNPIHTVETIVISVVSMLSDPTDESPANIDAAVRVRKHFSYCCQHLNMSLILSRRNSAMISLPLRRKWLVAWLDRKKETSSIKFCEA